MNTYILTLHVMNSWGVMTHIQTQITASTEWDARTLAESQYGAGCVALIQQI